MSQTVAYFDCFSGAAGDMILGAFVAAGLPVEALQDDLAKLPCGPVRLSAETVSRSGIRAVRVNVLTPEPAHEPRRGLRDIAEIVRNASLSETVTDRAMRVFQRLAEAEASVHGVPVDEIHFHEVGALDAIADIVGACCALEHLNVDTVLFSTLSLGRGTVAAAHGALPVPAPATAELVAGLKCQLGPVQAELLTPTAAAILTTLGRQDEPPPFVLEKIGYGAGARDHPGHPNVLRLLLGSVADDEQADTVWVIETNLDDCTPEVCGNAIDRLLAAGALDAFALPLHMKQSRPGILLSAIAPEGALLRVEDAFFKETTTFGVRRHRVERTKLAREVVSVETPYGPVRVKLGKRDGKVLSASPEFDDCARIAREQNVPLRHVMDAARKNLPG